MNSEMKRFFVGVFDDDEKMVSAAKELRDHKIKIYDFFTPFPVHGIDDLLEIKRTRLPIVCFIAASIGFLFACGFQIWTSAVDWPLNVGGKSFNSFPAFVPVAFEVTVLFGAFATVGAFLFRAKLFPKVELKTLHNKITDDRFVIAIEEQNSGLDEELVTKIFERWGAEEIVIKEGQA